MNLTRQCGVEETAVLEGNECPTDSQGRADLGNRCLGESEPHPIWVTVTRGAR
jgi:hypothetical protein